MIKKKLIIETVIIIMDSKQRQKLLTIFFCIAVVLGAIYGIFQKMLYLTKG